MYEIKLNIKKKKFSDKLILLLVKNGYDVYLSSDSFDCKDKTEICFNVPDEDVIKVKENGK